jgi:carboxypeptidase family protein/TonB-dependent receptor-like protein
MTDTLHRITSAVSVAALATVCAGTLFSQTARVSGRVSDPTGGVIPQADITLINEKTGVARRTKSNEVGYYAVPLLSPGLYQMIVRKDGFRPVNQSGIELKVNRRAVVDVLLDIGTVSEEVRVTADVPALNSTDASLGQVIENKRIVEMPLNGRDYIQLGLLTAGVVQPVGGRAGGISVSGQKTTQNNYLLDGLDNNSVEIAGAGRRAEMVKPSIEAVQEFKVQTSSYSAEFGRAMGGVVNVTTKSGTNQIHGAVYWFLRNEKLDAKNYFDHSDKDKPPFKRNQFGVAVGGPIKRGKTFYFADYEGTRVRESLTATSTIPTARMRLGDFSELPDAITDPSTGLPFPGGEVPGSRWDSLGTTLLSLYPDPQRSGRSANYTYQSPDRDDVNKFNTRLDHSFGVSGNLFARVSYHDRDFPAALALPGPSYSPGFDGAVTGWNAGLGYHHVFSPYLLASIRVGWNYAEFTRHNPAAVGVQNFNEIYGVPTVDQSQPGGFSNFNLAGYRNIGLGPFNAVDRDSQNRQVGGDLTILKSSHTIKLGANLLRSQNNIFNVRNEVGTFRFNGNYSGDAMSDLLLGQTRSFDWSNRLETNLRGWHVGLFAQDDWKVTRRLSLNLGFRYELVLPWQDTQDRMGIFDIDTDPANPRLIMAGTPEAGGGRMRRSLMATDYNNVMPRVGLAYKLSDKTVLRAGYGLFYGYLEPAGDAKFLIGNPPFAWAVTQTSDQQAPVFQLSEGPTPESLTLEEATGLTFSSYERRPQKEYAQQWNANIQREFTGNWLLEIGYAGSRGSHLLMRHDGNYSPPGPGDLNLKRRYESAAIPGTGITAMPLGPVIYHHFAGNLTYHALVTRVEKRFSDGFTLLGSYTFSKATGDTCGFSASGNTPACGYQDPRDLALEKSVDNQDVPHRLVFSGIWELPVGEGRNWSTPGGRVGEALFGSWNLGSIVSFASGRPYNLTVPGNPANTGSTAIVNRPNLIGNLRPVERSVDQDFDVSAVESNNRFEIGNLSRNALRQRDAFSWDFLAFKDFPIREDVRMQLRFEAFQFTNTPRFGVPGNEYGTANFGRITNAGTARNLQLGLKFLF